MYVNVGQAWGESSHLKAAYIPPKAAHGPVMWLWQPTAALCMSP